MFGFVWIVGMKRSRNMFEKELEEYKNQPKWKGKIFMKDEEICFKDGMELGYNKANEWHYLQDNPSDLPKNREKVLLLVKLNDKWNRTEVLIGYRDFGDCLGEYCKD